MKFNLLTKYLFVYAAVALLGFLGVTFISYRIDWANGEEYTPLLTGSDVKGAQAYTDTSSNSSSSFGVQLTFTDEGSTKFAEATKANLNKIIYIVYDGEVKSAPTVQSEITGMVMRALFCTFFFRKELKLCG